MTNNMKRTPSDQAPSAKAPARDGGLAHYEAEGRAVRANMEKLRALRLAREAAEAAAAPARPATKKAAGRSGGKGAKAGTRTGTAEKETPAKLSDWLASQQRGGFRT
jgi:hypothetical protein